MNLTSCDKCAVVLDKDKLNFPTNIHEVDGSVDDKKAVWDGDNYVPFVKCLICNEPITQK